MVLSVYCLSGPEVLVQSLHLSNIHDSILWCFPMMVALPTSGVGVLVSCERNIIATVCLTLLACLAKCSEPCVGRHFVPLSS